MFNRYWVCLLILAMPISALAQTTGGVFPAFINANTHFLQYRVAVDPNDAAGGTSLNQRLHYVNAINNDMQLVVFAGARQTQESDFDFDYVHAGFAFDLGEEGQKFRNGIRFDMRLRDGNRPNHVGINWMSHYAFESGWNARSVFLSNIQFGDNAARGVFLQSRFQLARRLQSGQSIGLEMFNFFGNTKKRGGFDSQNHSMGPTLLFSIAPKWSIFSSVLFGISDAAPDTQVRLWLSRSL